METVNKGVWKKDAMALLTGKPVYMDDIVPKGSLIVKLLRSPYAHAWIEDINTEAAGKVPGIECILTYEDCPASRFTLAGQSYPEPSPYDRKILDQRVRFVGDPVAIVAGESEDCVRRALKLIKVKYKVLDAVLDFTEALDNEVVIHPEEDFSSQDYIKADAKRNLCASGGFFAGKDIEEALKQCDEVIERTYHTKANSQVMLETFRSYTFLDMHGRLNVISSTQIPFHVRRILSNALEIPKSDIRVVKPRIGGGFGAKQTAVTEIYPAIVTLKTGKPAKILYSREECFYAGSPRHEMQITVRLGADRDGTIKAIHVSTLSNTGAYGEHGPTTVGLSGVKSMSLYSRAEAYQFDYRVVYTNTLSAGAYRGYGATQGIFALESTVNEMAVRLNIDPIQFRKQNLVREGEYMPTYYGETANSCALDRCLDRVKEMIGWEDKYPCKKIGNHKIRSVGVAVAMQGSAISGVDVGSVDIKLNDDGFYTLMIGATDMGTGCDTILAQIAAECMECEIDNIVVHGVDTDQSPYDSGSYASSTTYLTGMAVVKACERLKEKIVREGARFLECRKEEVEFDGARVYSTEKGCEIDLKKLANATYVGGSHTITANESHSSPVSPPPYMAGAVEIEIDQLTGEVKVIDYAAAVDCGTVINPNLARIQTEGGIVQGIGMTLFEDVIYDKKGRMMTNSLMQYKIPSRLDTGKIRVEFESSYEPTGPYGAKSIGEVVINTPAPAITNAVYNATGRYYRELPVTAEKIRMGMIRDEN
jgi:putative selenate reductase molybdopterin-binding subunit